LATRLLGVRHPERGSRYLQPGHQPSRVRSPATRPRQRAPEEFPRTLRM